MNLQDETCTLDIGHLIRVETSTSRVELKGKVGQIRNIDPSNARVDFGICGDTDVPTSDLRPYEPTTFSGPGGRLRKSAGVIRQALLALDKASRS